MTPITRIDAASHAFLLTEIKAAVAAVCAKHGLTVKQEGSSTRDREGTFANVKYRITVAGDGSAPVGKEASDFTRYAAMEGMDPAWLGRTLQHPIEGALTITGFRVKARKNPIIVRAQRNGKDYVYTVDGIKALAGIAGWPLPQHWTNEPKFAGLAQAARDDAAAERRAARAEAE